MTTFFPHERNSNFLKAQDLLITNRPKIYFLGRLFLCEGEKCVLKHFIEAARTKRRWAFGVKVKTKDAKLLWLNFIETGRIIAEL